MAKFFLLLILLFITIAVQSKVDVSFQSPISTDDRTIIRNCYRDVTEKLDALIALKKASLEKRCKLRIAMYELSSLAIISKLIAVAETGIHVEILTDTKQFSGVLERTKTGEQKKIKSELEKLSALENVEIILVGRPFIKGGHYNDIRTLHDKFTVMYCDDAFDQGIALMGSFNWTGAATKVNYESC